MIKLRKETFGGIAFNTANAHELWLDHELFSDMEEKIGQNAPRKSKAIEDVLRELDHSGEEINIINVKQTENTKKYPFPVLQSPALADINITSRCNLNCPHCYINSSRTGTDMTMPDFRLALKQCKEAGIFQIALGGGEPTLHPDFTKILKETRRAGIVPNITSNGYRLKWQTVLALARYAGAVALSIEGTGDFFETRRGFPFQEFIKSIKKLKHADIKLVFQITLSEKNLDEIPPLITFLKQFKPYGILFLAYKPEGRGKTFDRPIYLADQKKVKDTLDLLFQKIKPPIKLGFDCCLTPSLIGITDNPAFVGCSAGRTSVAIMPNLDVMPCSFLSKSEKYDNLKEKSLADIWQGKNINNFRNNISLKMKTELCNNCSSLSSCLGACPAFDLAKCQYKN